MSLVEILEFLGDLIARGSLLIAAAIVGGVVGWLLAWRYARRGLKQRIAELEGVKTHLEEKNEELGDRAREAEKEHESLGRQVLDLTQNYARATTENKRLRDAAIAADKKQEASLNRLHDLESEYLQVKKKLAELEAHFARGSERGLAMHRDYTLLTKQISNVLKQKGRVWETPLRPPIPPFVPLRSRKCPIISVLNFKGGVGKTTLTLNLGRALVGTGEKILLFDLDYQRSLTAMCLTASRALSLYQERRCLQHFLADAAHGGSALARCIEAQTRIKGCAVVANTSPEEGKDGLEDIEAHLLTEWLVRPEYRDVRLYLREALHSPDFAGRFDYVLLDCPPRLSVACINALAASDFVLIPVILDRLSASAVPRMLKFLRNLKRMGVLPDLEVLGVVCNRTDVRGKGLIPRQKAVREFLMGVCKAGWGEPVHCFDTTIRDLAGFGWAADNMHDDSASTLGADQDSGIGNTFEELASQVKERIKHAGGQLAAIPS